MSAPTRIAKQCATIALVTALAGATLLATPAGGWLEESLSLHWLFRARGAVQAPREVVIIDLDAESGMRLGQPPNVRDWSRDLHACLTNRLVALGAAVIVFDVFFSRPANGSSAAPTEAIRRAMPPSVSELCTGDSIGRSNDAVFAEAILNSRRVVLVEQLTTTHKIESGVELELERLDAPLPLFANSARGSGPFLIPKLPGPVRWFWVFKTTSGSVVPTLPMVTLQVYELRREETGGFRDDGDRNAQQSMQESVSLGPSTAGDLRHYMTGLRMQRVDQSRAQVAAPLAPFDGTRSFTTQILESAYAGPGARYFNLYGPPATIRTVPVASLLDAGSSDEPVDFEGAVVFVGRTGNDSPQQADNYYTVFSQANGIDLSGVELAATAFSNLSTDRSVRPLAPLWGIAVIVAMGIALGTIAGALQGWAGALGSVILAASYSLVAVSVFSISAVWLPLATCIVVQFPVVLALGWLQRHRLVAQERRQAEEAIRYYVPDNVARRIQSEGNPDTNTERVFGTCLATDIEGYTGISELLDPEDLAALTNEYFALLGEVVAQHQGQMLDIAGDGMTCIWRSPAPDPRVCRQACCAALRIRQVVHDFNRDRATTPLLTRIGLHAGWVALGNVGGGGHYVYSVIGDIVNTASRIEGLNRHLGTRVLAAEPAVAGVSGLSTRCVGAFLLKGKASPVTVFEILGSEESCTFDPALAEAFAEAMRLFREGQWEHAGRAFRAALAPAPGDGPSKFYLSRCEAILAGEIEPPESSIIRLSVK